jgi:hypothetical protein
MRTMFSAHTAVPSPSFIGSKTKQNISSIVVYNATILPNDGNLRRMEFSEKTERHSAPGASSPIAQKHLCDGGRPHTGDTVPIRQALRLWHQPQRPAAARSVNQITSPTGRIRDAGSVLSPDRTRSKISRLPSPDTRNATTELESSAG